jgi:hypothetical protein
MLLSAGLCFVLYTTVFLYLFGYLRYDEKRFCFHRQALKGLCNSAGSRDEAYSHLVAKRMMMCVLDPC